MKYTKYQKVRNASWQLLIDFNVKSLPVKIGDILNELEITFVSYEYGSDYIKKLGYKELSEVSDGFSVFYNGQFIIFYNDTRTKQRKRFVLAHELGHILLNHFENGNRNFTDEQEEQANIFASRLLAPACVLHELRLFTKEEIAMTCDVSLEFAEYRLKRLMELEERNNIFLNEKGYGCFYVSSLEREVAKQFKDFINTYS